MKFDLRIKKFFDTKEAYYTDSQVLLYVNNYVFSPTPTEVMTYGQMQPERSIISGLSLCYER